jgi:hypothetical protein
MCVLKYNKFFTFYVRYLKIERITCVCLTLLSWTLCSGLRIVYSEYTNFGTHCMTYVSARKETSLNERLVWNEMARLINRLKTRCLHNVSCTICSTPPYCNSETAPCGPRRVSIAKNGRRRRRAGVAGIHKQCGGAAEIGNRYRKWEISHRVWEEMLLKERTLKWEIRGVCCEASPSLMSRRICLWWSSKWEQVITRHKSWKK